MKQLFLLLLLILQLIGCNQNTSEEVKTDTENPNYISHRNLLNTEFAKHNFKTEKQWDSLHKISIKKKNHPNSTLLPGVRTFGWHIYPNGSMYKNYNFSLLWGVSYFSYEIQPKTGSYKNIHQWKTTALIDSAKTKGCKVFLSVSNFGAKNNRIFLENKKAQKVLGDSLAILLNQRSANGINIDFEGVSRKNRKQFSQFIINISKHLKEVNPNYQVSLCLYAKDWNDIFDINAIDTYVDFYTLMGYDYFGSFSKITGPVTPFAKTKKFGKGLQSSIDYYHNKGVRFDKLIVGLPYYGAEWYTKKPKIGSIVNTFKSHPRYHTIKSTYIDSLKIPVQFDPKSSSSYIVMKDFNNEEYRQLFFEDVKSLSIKYDWIKEKKISGIGIWALGYDEGYDELWDLIAEKFSK
ncbi:glycosyl hydrolase family 18 protein [Aquimarina sp. 433]